MFDHTYEEIIHNIQNAKRWLSKADCDIDRASKTLLFFLTNDWTILEIDNLLNQIDAILLQYKIDVEDVKWETDEQKYNINVKKLRDIIVEEYRKNNEYFDEVINSQLLDNDIRSINMVYRKIHDNYPRRFKDLKIVFMCANNSLARACRCYHLTVEKQTEQDFVPICVPALFLGTYMWLKVPIHIDELAKRKLIVESSSILQPTDSMIRKYLIELKNCYNRKVISEDDYLLGKASSVINEFLLEHIDNTHTITDKTPVDILSKLKSQSREEGLRKFYQERDVHQKTLRELEKEKREKDDFKLRKQEKIYQMVSLCFDLLITLIIFIASFIVPLMFKIKIIAVSITSIITIATFWGFARGQKFYNSLKDKVIIPVRNKIFQIVWGDLWLKNRNLN